MLTFWMDHRMICANRFRLGTLLLVLCAGCGRSDRLPTAYVNGTVTFEGAPVPTGSLLFVPEGGGPAAQGNISKDGSYTLGTYTTSDGAILGRFQVMITAFAQPKGGSGLPEDMMNSNTESLSLIPEIYGDLEKSGLTATVDGGSNTIDFNLVKPEDPKKK